MAIANSLDNY